MLKVIFIACYTSTFTQRILYFLMYVVDESLMHDDFSLAFIKCFLSYAIIIGFWEYVSAGLALLPSSYFLLFS